MPGALNNNVSLPQKDGKGDVQKDVNNIDGARMGVAHRALSPPTKDDFDTIGIISPMRDGECLGCPATVFETRTQHHSR